MIPILSDLAEAGAGLRRQVAEVLVRIRRTAPGPALVRITAFASALVAFVAALPVEVLPPEAAPGQAVRLILGILPLAAGVGLFPRTRWVGLVAVATVLVWLLTTIGFGDAVTPVRVGILATALYVMHASAAVAAVLPYDCLVAPRVLWRWAGRVLTALVAGLPLGIGGMLLLSVLPSARSVVGPIVGAAVAAGLTGLLAWHLRRRPDAG